VGNVGRINEEEGKAMAMRRVQVHLHSGSSFITFTLSFLSLSLRFS
jgi:hypothetical protein